MLRVVADANVLISAALARSPQAPSVLTQRSAATTVTTASSRSPLKAAPQRSSSGDLDLLAIEHEAVAVEVLTPRQLIDRLS